MDRQPDHRRFPRISSQHAVLVKKLGPKAVEEITRTKVVGLGGCMFVSDESVGVGAAVELLMAVRGEALRALSRVVWERSRESGGWEIGVEFLEISDAHRELIRELLAEPDANGG